MMYFEGMDWRDFWEDGDYDRENAILDAPTDELIASIEAELGYKLPASYIWLMKQHNGGTPRAHDFPIEMSSCWAGNYGAISGILGIGREKAKSLCGEQGSQFMIKAWGYPPIGVAIGECPTAEHGLIFLDYRDCGPEGEPPVVHVDRQRDYAITKICDNFEAFIRSLVKADALTAAFYTNREPIVYNDAEKAAVVKHIEAAFGPIDQVLHELYSPDIHVDIGVVGPTERRPYYTLVTMGMGARPMNVPDELADWELERAELLLTLPADWPLDDGAEEWYWPIGLLKFLARLPGEADIWLGWGNIIDNEGPYAANTALCAALLTGPMVGKMGAASMTLPNGEAVNFYQVLPLYCGEMEYGLARGADRLLREVANCYVITPDRPDLSAMAGFGDKQRMDNAAWHLANIQGKHLPVEELAAYNHLAIYLRWSIEQGLMSAEFSQRFAETVEQVKTAPEQAHLREFLRDELDGLLRRTYFNDAAADFAAYYYNYDDTEYWPFFPSDIDDYALNYFGPERYHSNEFKQEAYLFIPFDENYYQAMARVIDRRWTLWQETGGESLDEVPSELSEAFMDYLDCSCRYFPPLLDDDPILAQYGYSSRLGVREGFTPVLVAVDETLWETLITNADASARDEDFDPRAVAAYRAKMLSLPLTESAEASELAKRLRLAAEAGLAGEAEGLGEPDGDQARNRFEGYWAFDSYKTMPLILAEIDVPEPWQIFAYLPFGGWNACPDTPELMAMAKRWYEAYGAVPAVITHDVLEFRLPQPVDREKAQALALEQYAWCPDLVEQGVGTVGALADTLSQSTVWYFWWD